MFDFKSTEKMAHKKLISQNSITLISKFSKMSVAYFHYLYCHNCSQSHCFADSFLVLIIHQDKNIYSSSKLTASHTNFNFDNNNSIRSNYEKLWSHINRTKFQLKELFKPRIKFEVVV